MSPAPSPSDRERALFLAGSLVLAALPFALVTFPPSADLPQQAAQIRLLDEQLGLAPETTPRELYEIRWWAPNNLVYALFFVTARVLEPIAAARAALAILALAIVAAVHELARRRGRPPEHAMLAGTLVFSCALYWGFVGFLLGAAIFLLVVDRALRAPDPAHRARDVAVLAVLATLLYAAHSLWLPALGVALLVGPLVARREGALRLALPRALALLPALVHAAYWFPRLHAERAESHFDVEARWRPLDERLARIASGDSIYGGLEGPLEPAMSGVLLLWIVAAVAPREGTEARGGIDRPLLALAGAIAIFVLVAPDKYANTIEMSARYGFVAAILALLAAPRPKLPELARRALPALASVAFATMTAAAWVAVDRDELAGLEETVRAEPGPARVLGLDFVRESEHLDGRPFLQAFAWRQALHGGELGFSFAEHRGGIVGYRAVRRTPWTPRLEWTAERVTTRDLSYFDLVVLGGTPEQHAGLSRRAGTRVIGEGRFRLHRIVR